MDPSGGRSSTGGDDGLGDTDAGAEGGAVDDGGAGSNPGMVIGDPGTAGSTGTVTGTGPDGVFMVGNVTGVSNMGVAPVTAINKYVYGFPEAVQTGFRGADFIYLRVGGKPTVFKHDNESSPNPTTLVNGPDVTGNDEKIDATPCSAVQQFLTNPDSRLIYQCTTGSGWYEAGTEVYKGTFRLLALGANDLAFAYSSTAGFGPMSLTDGQIKPISGITDVLAVRVHGSGFHVAVTAATGATLLNVTDSSTFSAIGTYSAALIQNGMVSTVLAADDSLYAIQTPGGTGYTITRYTPKGAKSVVATQSTKDYLLWTEAELVTGP